MYKKSLSLPSLIHIQYEYESLQEKLKEYIKK